MSSSLTSGTERADAPHYISIPLRTVAQAQGLLATSFPTEAFRSAKGACQVAEDWQYKSIGRVELGSAESQDTYGTVIDIPRQGTEKRLSALEIVNMLCNDRNKCRPHSTFHISCPVEWLFADGAATELVLAEPWHNVVWEPYFEGDHCRPDRLGAIKEACKKLAIFATNHVDLLAMCSKTSEFHDEVFRFSKRNRRIDYGRMIIEECVWEFLNSGIGNDRKGYMVVKAGDFGCLVASSGFSGRFRWVAEYGMVDSENTRREKAEFIGALTFKAFNMSQHNIIRAAELAMVAATFAEDDALGDAEAFASRERAYSHIQRAETERQRFPRDPRHSWDYTHDKEDEAYL